MKNKTLDENIIKKIGFPLVDSVIQRSLVATGGTVLASKLAIKNGVACNTAGGSHHANFEGGAGYCKLIKNRIGELRGTLKDFL